MPPRALATAFIHPPDSISGLVDQPALARRLALVHGFTQNSACWSPFDSLLARSFEVAKVDLPGHGGSSAISADIEASARLVGDACGQCAYLGYSLGGRTVLQLAVAEPKVVEKLVLIGASPGIEDPAERAARKLSDSDLAHRLDLPPGTADDRAAETLDSFLAAWTSQPMFSGIALQDLHLPMRRRNTCAGLARSLRLCGTGTQRPLWDDLGALAMDVLVIAGEHDEKFSSIGRRMARKIGPNAEFVSVGGAGHACHVEKPAAVVALVRDFLS